MALDFTGKMQVREAMSSPVVSVGEGEDMVAVAEKMRDQNVGAVVVVNQFDNPVGIVTERDIVNRVVARGLDPKAVLARDVMSSPVKMVEPTLDLIDALRIMDRENIRRLGVIYKGEMVGILSDRSILRLVPAIMDILRETREILDNSRVRGSVVGYCDRCEAYSRNLVNVDGRFLCEECRLEP